MKSSWLYEQSSLWIVAGLLVATVLAGEIGCLAGRRKHPSLMRPAAGPLVRLWDRCWGCSPC